MRALLVVPRAVGGEGVYARLLQDSAPDGVSYAVSDDFKAGAPGAPCAIATEVALNRLVRPYTIPDIGFRALRLRERFDLVHVHAHPVRLTRARGVPLVMSEGSSSAVYLADYLGWAPDRIERAFRRTTRLYHRLGVRDRLLTMERLTRAYVFSEWARELNIRWGADPAKLDVVAPGFHLPEGRSRESRTTFTFLFVGGDFERKGGFDVIEAFARISEDHPQVRLLIVGSDPRESNPDRLQHHWVGDRRRRRLLDQLDELGRRGLARELGPIPSAELSASVYPSGDAFVMPSLAEGFGFTNVEAMGQGLPVISSRVGPIPEVVADGEAGLLVTPGDVDALAAAMERLAANPDAARTMGAAGRREFERRYTIGGFRERLGAFYERALQS